jgi:hypothetical protein
MRKLKKLIIEHFEISLIILIFLGIFAIAFLVHYKFSFLNFFFLPVILAGYYLGKKQAVLIGTFCVLLIILYLIFTRLGFAFASKPTLTLDDIINLVTWGSFLIITAAIIGQVSEQRESRIANIQRAYIGVLDIMLKYLEVADEEKPHSLRVSLLAGMIAKRAGLSTREIENIKSVALLCEAGELQSSLPLFEEVAGFMGAETNIVKTPLSSREKVMLKTTASLLKEIEPLLVGYFRHYVQEADQLDKKLEEIPVGASVIAIAELLDWIQTQGVAHLGKEEFQSYKDIEKLSGRTFHEPSVRALREVILTL